MLIFFCRFCCSGQVLRFHRSSRGPLVVWCLAFFETNPQEVPPTRWAPSPAINGITPINWPCKWATTLITLLITWFIALSIAGRGPSVPCIHSSSFFVASCRHLLQQTVGALGTFTLLLDGRVLGLKFFEMRKLCQGILGKPKI